MQRISRTLHREGKIIGLVPTMGYLHKGHAYLISRSKKTTGITVVSIFVNPAQFAPNEDFNKYPRDFQRDKKMLEELHVDYLFTPSPLEIYPDDFKSFTAVEEVTQILEGKFRPTHFRGVTTIVAILFNIIDPDFAFFGQKDAQQSFIIKKMVEDLKFPVKVIVAPIVREKHGLALSSRNIYLSDQEKNDALILSRSLKYAAKKIEDGEYKVSKIISEMRKIIRSIESSNLDYISINDELTFMPAEELIKGKKYFVLIACRIGNTRLIDNILIRA